MPRVRGLGALGWLLVVAAPVVLSLSSVLCTPVLWHAVHRDTGCVMRGDGASNLWYDEGGGLCGAAEAANASRCRDVGCPNALPRVDEEEGTEEGPSSPSSVAFLLQIYPVMSGVLAGGTLFVVALRRVGSLRNSFAFMSVSVFTLSAIDMAMACFVFRVGLHLVQRTPLLEGNAWVVLPPVPGLVLWLLCFEFARRGLVLLCASSFFVQGLLRKNYVLFCRLDFNNLPEDAVECLFTIAIGPPVFFSFFFLVSTLVATASVIPLSRYYSLCESTTPAQKAAIFFANLAHPILAFPILSFASALLRYGGISTRFDPVSELLAEWTQPAAVLVLLVQFASLLVRYLTEAPGVGSTPWMCAGDLTDGGFDIPSTGPAIFMVWCALSPFIPSSVPADSEGLPDTREGWELLPDEELVAVLTYCVGAVGRDADAPCVARHLLQRGCDVRSEAVVAAVRSTATPWLRCGLDREARTRTLHSVLVGAGVPLSRIGLAGPFAVLCGALALALLGTAWLTYLYTVRAPARAEPVPGGVEAMWAGVVGVPAFLLCAVWELTPDWFEAHVALCVCGPPADDVPAAPHAARGDAAAAAPGRPPPQHLVASAEEQASRAPAFEPAGNCGPRESGVGGFWPASATERLLQPQASVRSSRRMRPVASEAGRASGTPVSCSSADYHRLIV